MLNGLLAWFYVRNINMYLWYADKNWNFKAKFHSMKKCGVIPWQKYVWRILKKNLSIIILSITIIADEVGKISWSEFLNGILILRGYSLFVYDIARDLQRYSRCILVRSLALSKKPDTSPPVDSPPCQWTTKQIDPTLEMYLSTYLQVFTRNN